jgi:hypothetical protein
VFDGSNTCQGPEGICAKEAKDIASPKTIAINFFIGLGSIE